MKRLSVQRSVELLEQQPWTLVPFVIVVVFWGAFYTYGALSCRGGDMWNLVTAKRHQAYPDMSATWLAQPLKAVHEYDGIANTTCGGTVAGKRPHPEVDYLVCTPSMDVKADDTWLAWKTSFISLAGLSLAFLAIGMPFRKAVRSTSVALEEAGAERPTEFSTDTVALELAHFTACDRRWNFIMLFGLIWGIAAHGLVGSAIMYLFCFTVFRLARKVADWKIGNAQFAIWVVVLLTMEFTFRCLGDAAHVVDPSRGNAGVHFWSRLEAFLCGDKLAPEKLKTLSPAEACGASQLFFLKGLCPWYLYRFMGLKLISYGCDYVWHAQDTPSIFGVKLDSKSELEQRTERNNLRTYHYSWKLFSAYMFYVPLYSVGPILSYNAFVSQIERPQKSHSHGDILAYFSRLVGIIAFMEVFSVVWWYPFEFHTQTCNGTKPCMFDDLGSWELFLATHVRLHFTWMSLLIVWRFGRLIALFDGVDCWENMTKCVSTITSFSDLWQIWHASMNKFMARYLYMPLGGNKCPWAVIIVFTFIGYWHEGTGIFSVPQWYAWAFFNALGVTLEKVLMPPVKNRVTFTMRLARREFRIYVIRGVTVLFVMLANLPAQYYQGVWAFYARLLFDGWRSVLLILAIVGAYTCQAFVEDFVSQDPEKAGLRSFGLPFVDNSKLIKDAEATELASAVSERASLQESAPLPSPPPCQDPRVQQVPRAPVPLPVVPAGAPTFQGEAVDAPALASGECELVGYLGSFEASESR